MLLFGNKILHKKLEEYVDIMLVFKDMRNAWYSNYIIWKVPI